MNKASIKNTLIEILKKIAPEADFEQFSPDADMREELDIDSIDYYNFIVQIDEKFDIEIPEADYQKLDTLNNAVEYISKQMEKV